MIKITLKLGIVGMLVVLPEQRLHYFTHPFAMINVLPAHSGA